MTEAPTKTSPCGDRRRRISDGLEAAFGLAGAAVENHANRPPATTTTEYPVHAKSRRYSDHLPRWANAVLA
jgi:hypothetical protein